VTIWNPDSASDAVRLAGELRAGGLRTDVYPDADKLGKQFKYASARGIRLVTVVGGDERAQGVVTVKDMDSGKQSTASRGEVADVLRQTSAGGS
jgi:histidyl-tRNA synthetase